MPAASCWTEPTSAGPAQVAVLDGVLVDRHDGGLRHAEVDAGLRGEQFRVGRGEGFLGGAGARFIVHPVGKLLAPGGLEDVLAAALGRAAAAQLGAHLGDALAAQPVGVGRSLAAAVVGQPRQLLVPLLVLEPRLRSRDPHLRPAVPRGVLRGRAGAVELHGERVLGRRLDAFLADPLPAAGLLAGLRLVVQAFVMRQVGLRRGDHRPALVHERGRQRRRHARGRILHGGLAVFQRLQLGEVVLELRPRVLVMLGEVRGHALRHVAALHVGEHGRHLGVGGGLAVFLFLPAARRLHLDLLGDHGLRGLRLQREALLRLHVVRQPQVVCQRRRGIDVGAFHGGHLALQRIDRQRTVRGVEQRLRLGGGSLVGAGELGVVRALRQPWRGLRRIADAQRLRNDRPVAQPVEEPLPARVVVASAEGGDPLDFIGCHACSLVRVSAAPRW